MRTLVMVMPRPSLVEKARTEGFAVHAVWDLRLAATLHGAAAAEHLDTLAGLTDGLEFTDVADPAHLESTLLGLIQRVRPDALHQAGGEDGVPDTTRLAQRCGLAVNPPGAVEALEDRAALRRVLDAAGVAPGSLLAEEHPPGPQYGVETLSAGGRHQVVGTTGTLLGTRLSVVATGHLHPAPDAALREALAEATTRLLALAGYRTGPAHTVVRMTAAGPRIVRSQARAGGDRIPRLVELATGVDLELGALRALRGELPDVPAGPGRIAGIAYLGLPVGRVAAITGIQRVRDLPFVDEVSLPVAVGDRVPARVDPSARHGHVIVVGGNRAQLERRLRQVRQVVEDAVTVVPEPFVTRPVARRALEATARLAGRDRPALQPA